MKTGECGISKRHMTVGRLCALGASAIFLLGVCLGCDDQIHTDIRQGALGVFESVLDQAYSGFSDAVSEGISTIGDGS